MYAAGQVFTEKEVEEILIGLGYQKGTDEFDAARRNHFPPAVGYDSGGMSRFPPVLQLLGSSPVVFHFRLPVGN